MLLRYHGLIPSICEARSDRDTQIEDDPLIVRFGCQSGGPLSGSFHDPINGNKQARFLFECHQQRNPCKTVDAGAEHCRLNQRALPGHGDRSEAEQSHVRSGALKCEDRIPADLLEPHCKTGGPHRATEIDAAAGGGGLLEQPCPAPGTTQQLFWLDLDFGSTKDREEPLSALLAVECPGPPPMLQREAKS